MYIYTHTCKVVERVHSLIERLEAEHQDTAIAFFSHADTVQILQVKNQKSQFDNEFTCHQIWGKKTSNFKNLESNYMELKIQSLGADC